MIDGEYNEMSDFTGSWGFMDWDGNVLLSEDFTKCCLVVWRFA